MRLRILKTMNDMLWWVEDLSAATENILLQLEEEGLGGVWIGTWPDEDRVGSARIFSFGLLSRSALSHAV